MGSSWGAEIIIHVYISDWGERLEWQQHHER